MSLLDQGTDEVTVFLEETTTDADGNTVTRPSVTGIKTRARLQWIGQSGTSARRAETNKEGFESEIVYRLRFPRSWLHILGAQSQIEWHGVRWSVFGDAHIFNGSRNTRHIEYEIKRF